MISLYAMKSKEYEFRKFMALRIEATQTWFESLRNEAAPNLPTTVDGRAVSSPEEFMEAKWWHAIWEQDFALEAAEDFYEGAVAPATLLAAREDGGAHDNLEFVVQVLQEVYETLAARLGLPTSAIYR